MTGTLAFRIEKNVAKILKKILFNKIYYISSADNVKNEKKQTN